MAEQLDTRAARVWTRGTWIEHAQKTANAVSRRARRSRLCRRWPAEGTERLAKPG